MFIVIVVTSAEQYNILLKGSFKYFSTWHNLFFIFCDK